MALNDALLNVGAQAMMNAATHAAIGDGPLSTDEVSAARQVISWSVAANGDMILTTDENFTGPALASATVRPWASRKFSQGIYTPRWSGFERRRWSC